MDGFFFSGRATKKGCNFFCGLPNFIQIMGILIGSWHGFGFSECSNPDLKLIFSIIFIHNMKERKIRSDLIFLEGRIRVFHKVRIRSILSTWMTAGIGPEEERGRKGLEHGTYIQW